MINLNFLPARIIFNSLKAKLKFKKKSMILFPSLCIKRQAEVDLLQLQFVHLLKVTEK